MCFWNLGYDGIDTFTTALYASSISTTDAVVLNQRLITFEALKASIVNF